MTDLAWSSGDHSADLFVYSRMPGYGTTESFELPVQYQNKEITLPGKLVQMGYTYKIYIDVEGQEIIFEPDEERNFRAIVEKDQSGRPVSVEFIRAIGASLEEYLK